MTELALNTRTGCPDRLEREERKSPTLKAVSLIRLWVICVLCVMVATAGCTTSLAYLSLPHDERRLFDIYSAFMTNAQQAEYVSRTTSADREAYAESLGVRQRFLALSEEEREAVLNADIMRGMSADALLMSWGHPRIRTGFGEDEEDWAYQPEYTHFLPWGTYYHIYLRGGRVYDWVHFDEYQNRG